ncbi:MAG: hypothetical protein RR513_06590 [Muribaculaceae bacterium]
MGLKTKDEATLWLENVSANKSIEAKWGKRVKRVSNWANGKCDLLVAKIGLKYGMDKQSVTEIMNDNREMIPRYLSYVILHNFIYISLFHWIYWRYINAFWTTKKMLDGLMIILNDENNNMSDFFACMTLIQKNNTMIEMTTKASILSISQKLNSEDVTTPSSPYTEQ